MSKLEARPALQGKDLELNGASSGDHSFNTGFVKASIADVRSANLAPQQAEVYDPGNVSVRESNVLGSESAARISVLPLLRQEHPSASPRLDFAAIRDFEARFQQAQGREWKDGRAVIKEEGLKNKLWTFPDGAKLYEGGSTRSGDYFNTTVKPDGSWTACSILLGANEQSVKWLAARRSDGSTFERVDFRDARGNSRFELTSWDSNGRLRERLELDGAGRGTISRPGPSGHLIVSPVVEINRSDQL
jgi:hypothetical protein